MTKVLVKRHAALGVKRETRMEMLERQADEARVEGESEEILRNIRLAARNAAGMYSDVKGRWKLLGPQERWRRLSEEAVRYLRAHKIPEPIAREVMRKLRLDRRPRRRPKECMHYVLGGRDAADESEEMDMRRYGAPRAVVRLRSFE